MNTLERQQIPITPRGQPWPKERIEAYDEFCKTDPRPDPNALYQAWYTRLAKHMESLGFGLDD